MRLDIPNFPCNTQAVERHVKLLSQASASVCNEESTDGIVKLTHQSREKMKTFDIKKEFQL